MQLKTTATRSGKTMMSSKSSRQVPMAFAWKLFRSYRVVRTKYHDHLYY